MLDRLSSLYSYLKLRRKAVVIVAISVVAFQNARVCRGFAPPRVYTSQSRSSPSRLYSTEEEIYKNRALVAQHVLESKIKDLQLMSNKTQLLENVVLRMKDQLKTQQSQSNSTIEEEQLVQKNLRSQLHELQREVEQARVALQSKQDRHTQQMKEMKDQISRDQEAFSRQEEEYREREKALQKRVQTLQRELLELDDSLEKSQQELVLLQTKYDRELSQLESKRRQEEVKLTREVESVKIQRDSLQAQLANKNATLEEQLQIARASVAAAERRENEWREKFEAIQVEYQKLLERENLNEVEELRDQIAMLKSKYAIEERIKQKQVEDRIASMKSKSDSSSPRSRRSWRRILRGFIR